MGSTNNPLIDIFLDSSLVCLTLYHFVRRNFSLVAHGSLGVNEVLPVGGSTMTFVSGLKECSIIFAVV